MDKGNLSYKTANAVKIVSVVSGSRFVIQLVTQLALVRLLSPEIFGIFAFSHMVVSFFGLFTNLNGNKLIIQRKDSPKEFVDVVFTLEFLLGALTTIVVFLFADNIAHLIGKDVIAEYIRILCVVVILNSCNLVPKAIFERDLDFKRATMPALFGAAANGISSIVLVLNGFGIYALIYGVVIGRLIEVATLWVILPSRPVFRFDKTVTGECLRYGLPITVSMIVAYLYWNIDDFMVSKLLGDKQLGYYWVAFKFPHYLLFIQSTLSIVLLPAFSRTDDSEQLKRSFETVTKLSAICLFILCIISMVFGREIIGYFFGEQWLPATVPFQIFMVLVTVRGILAPWVDVYLSRGRSRATLMNFVNLIGITFLGYFLTLWLGISGMAMAVLISILLSIPLIKYVMSSIFSFSYIKLIFKPLIVSFFVLCFGFVLKNNISLSFLSFLLASLSLLVIYFTVLFLWEREFFLDGKKFLLKR